jgi:hypothetical protein
MTKRCKACHSAKEVILADIHQRGAILARHFT